MVVVEKLHLAAQVRFPPIERQNFKAPFAARVDVETAVSLAVANFLHEDRAAGTGDAVASRQHDAELGSGRGSLAYHFLVTGLEYMQGDYVAGEHDQSQGKERKQPVERAGHGAIIAFPDRYQQLLDGKVVIITGASEGIGASLAVALRKRGALLTLASRNETRLCSVADAESLIVSGDLTQDAVRRAVIEKTLERRGRIDVLINNAGRGSYYAGSTTPMDEARAVFDLNFFAPLALAQLTIPHLRETRGTIVNISSIAGQIPLPWLPVYSASKAALASITATQRIELRRDGVNVMGVFPGYVKTNFQANAPGPRPPARVVQGKRFAVSAEDCAAAIVRGIENRKRTVVTPGSGWPLMLIHRMFPALVESRLEAV